MELIVEPRDGFLLAIGSGEVSFGEAVESCWEICNLAGGLGVKKILLDCLALKGDLSPEERFELAKNLAEYCQRRLTIFSVALIGKPPAVTGLGARAASNPGNAGGDILRPTTGLGLVEVPTVDVALPSFPRSANNSCTSVPSLPLPVLNDLRLGRPSASVIP